MPASCLGGLWPEGASIPFPICTHPRKTKLQLAVRAILLIKNKNISPDRLHELTPQTLVADAAETVIPVWFSLY